MRILLTGANGFIGSHVLEELIQNKHDVTIVIRSDSDGWRRKINSINYRTIIGNLADSNDVISMVTNAKPEIIIHLAWDGVKNNSHDHQKQFKNIALGTTLMKAAKQQGLKRWIALGSQAEYGKCGSIVDEKEPTKPITNYGKAKLGAFESQLSLAKDLGISFSWIRLFTAYGPKDWGAWIIPYLILEMLKSKAPDLTAGEQMWDFLFVQDAAKAIVKLAMLKNSSSLFNLGSSSPIKIKTVAELIRNSIDPYLELGIGKIPYKKDQIMHLEADTTRIREATGWTPKTSFEDGIKQTIKWFEKNAFRYT